MRLSEHSSGQATRPGQPSLAQRIVAASPPLSHNTFPLSSVPSSDGLRGQQCGGVRVRMHREVALTVGIGKEVARVANARGQRGAVGQRAWMHEGEDALAPALLAARREAMVRQPAAGTTRQTGGMKRQSYRGANTSGQYAAYTGGYEAACRRWPLHPSPNFPEENYTTNVRSCTI